MIQRKKPMNRGKSQLKRTELKRGTSQLKRSPIARTSPKNRKQTSKFGPIRAAFKKELGCPCGRIATDVHEVHGGSSRGVTFEKREAWIALCREHHEEVQDWSDKVYQYALKQITDPTAYDRVKLNELAGWAEESISESEVVSALSEVEAWIREIRK